MPRFEAALQAGGWYSRQDLICRKPAVMPESVTDRITKAREYVLLLTKNERNGNRNQRFDCWVY